MIEIIPNWHPILVHFTIALLAIATLLFILLVVVGRGRSLSGLEATANWNLWLGAGLTALTIAAGLDAASSVAHDDAAHLAMEDHKLWALGTATFFMLLALWNVLRVRRQQGVSIAFVALMVIAVTGLAGTGLRGADLVYRHGLGVMSLPQVAGDDGGHEHEDGAEHSHEDAAPAAAKTVDDSGHAPPAGAPPTPPPPEQALSPTEAEVVTALTAYHDALTSGDLTAPEEFVLPDERFLMFEGKHVNRGWVDYRDHHLKEELGDLAKVRFRLSGYQVQVDGKLAVVSFIFNVLPKTGPEMDFGSGRATAVLLRTGSGWKLSRLHTS